MRPASTMVPNQRRFDAHPPETYYRPSMLTKMRETKGVVAIFIVANALTAGSIFCFPLFGPKMSSDLGLSLTQTNAIWSAAILGQYASAAIFGHIADVYGPRPLSLLASILFGAGYILMARTESGAIARNQSEATLDQASQRANFISMAAYFVLVGTGVAASLFSALRSSTSHFKSHPGLSLSVPLTLFSLSSLFLSAFASLSFFTDPKTGDLNSPRWLAWLGAALMVTNALSAVGLSTAKDTQEVAADASTATHDPLETTPLLRSNAIAKALPLSIPFGRRQEDYGSEPLLTLGEFLSSPSVWIMGFILFASVGGSEMVMSSIGSMVVSLRATPKSFPGMTFSGSSDDDDNIRLGKETLALRTRQVQLLAIANTIARLSVGFFSDLIAPKPAGRSSQSASSASRSAWRRPFSGITISRLTLLMCGQLLLLGTFVYCALFLNSVDQLWIVSLATGTGYGLTFTLLPSMVICVWPTQFGRNYGLLTYAAALGSLCFSMLFASINDAVAARHQGNDTGPGSAVGYTLSLSASKTTSTVSTAICTYGRDCFSSSFTFAAVTVALAMGATVPLWRAWRALL